MTQKTVTILGARSDIAMACVHAFGAAGYVVTLAARDSETLAADARDIELRYGQPVGLRDFDALDLDGHLAFVDGAPLADVVISAVGVLGDQDADADDFAAAARVLRSNFEGPALVLGAYANAMEARGSGVIVGMPLLRLFSDAWPCRLPPRLPWREASVLP